MTAPKKATKAPKKKAPEAPKKKAASKKVTTRKNTTKAAPKAKKKVVRPDTRGGRAVDRILGVRTMDALEDSLESLVNLVTKGEEVTKKEWMDFVTLLEVFTNKVDASVFSVMRSDGHALITGKIGLEEYISDMAEETAGAFQGTPIISTLGALRDTAKTYATGKGFKVDVGRRNVRVVEEPVEKPTPPVVSRKWETDEEMFRALGIA